jgi:polynucleotide 5'-hydroxyl-kinase GRC3/NOL9
MRYLLPQNKTLLIRGPASFQLSSGDAAILGAPLAPAQKQAVSHERQLPVEARRDTELEISLGWKGKLFEVDGSTISSSWQMAADALAEMERGKVVVLGATDVGKSTFCTYLTNNLHGRVQNLRIIDADIGQADIGPPTTISAAIPKTPITSLMQLIAQHIIFIGDTSPGPVAAKLTHGLLGLTRGYDDSLIVINTDGWVDDPLAISYKIGLITALKPDLVLALAESTELQPILSACGSNSLIVQTSKELLVRSRGDRRKIRTASYRRFLSGARMRKIARSDIQITTPHDFPFVNRGRNFQFEKLVIGLLDDAGYLLYLGILQSVENQALRVFCKSADGVRKIDIGRVRLSTDGVEIGFFDG